jgi:hypothetical protein
MPNRFLSGLKLAKYVGLHIPFLDLVEEFIGYIKPKYTVEYTAVGHQIAASKHHTKTFPPTTELL